MSVSARNHSNTGRPKIIKSAGAKTLQAPEVWIPESSQVPTVECEVVDGVVKTITVRCACGCVTNLSCESE